MASADAPAIHCNIDVEHQSSSVSLRGRIVSARGTSGDYRLEIQARSRSGSSEVNQAGQFEVEPQAPVFLGLANLSMEAGMRLVARLTVQTAEAQRCSAEREISDE